MSIKVIKRFKGGTRESLIDEMNIWQRKNKDILKGVEINHRINTVGTVMCTSLDLEIYQVVTEKIEKILPYIK